MHTTLEGLPTAVSAMVWATVSDEAHQRLLAGDHSLLSGDPSAWNTGSHIWIAVMTGPEPFKSQLFQEVLISVFQGQSVHVWSASDSLKEAAA
jgi:hemolysin-activating ACP:hemolysin acyltransferase